VQHCISFPLLVAANRRRDVKQCYNNWQPIHFCVPSHTQAVSQALYSQVHRYFNDIIYSSWIFFIARFLCQLSSALP
jgi:hypothetical protein